VAYSCPITIFRGINMIKDIIDNIRNNEDCRFVVFGVNKDGNLEYFKCYTYLQCNEIISDMKYSGYTKIKSIKI
jgi:hypothetical protein